VYGCRRLWPWLYSQVSTSLGILSALFLTTFASVYLWLQVAVGLVQSGALTRLPTTRPSALAHCGWAVAKLRHDPGPAWLSRYLAACMQALPVFSALDCAACCWALARWGFQPASPWCDALYTRLM
jgi:hypothetical protein